MKKVSAFSLLKGKKDKEMNLSSGTLRKASSTPVMNQSDDKTSNKLLRAIKGGSFRKTIKGNKHRPTFLSDGVGNSPFVAGDGAGVKLTGVKDKATKATTNGDSFPTKLKMLPPDITPKLPPRKALNKETSKVSVASPPQIPRKPEITKPIVTPTLPKKQPPQPQATPKQSNTSSPSKKPNTSTKKKDKRSREPDSPQQSIGKRKRVSSPISSSSKTTSPAPVQVNSVRPQKKPKSEKRQVSPTTMMESMYDSQDEAKKLFECMLHPAQVDKFFSELWERKPLLVTRHLENYNDGWFSTKELDTILQEEHIQFGVNLDVTSYRDGKRETHNPPGRAYRPVVWDFYQTGCSVRLLNPQTYSRNVWRMLSTLQEYFGCMVGANVYLTPPGTQGFAPHYDDIEAFILQLEGKKRWRLYSPRSEGETLPQTSSHNFTEDDIGAPILDVTLCAGDLLYFPRGTIHQGHTLDDAHSLHITVSCFQKNTWGDLFQKLVPRALEIAVEEDVQFREGLPVDYLNYMGLVNTELESQKRDMFLQKVNTLMQTMLEQYLPVDAACDQMGKRYITDTLPPFVTEGERSCSVHGHGEKWVDSKKCVQGNTEIDPDTMVKLIRKGCLRLVTEDDAVRIYHNLENSRVYQGRDVQYIDISAELATSVEFLLHNYPDYVGVNCLPAPSLDECLEIANVLYDKGLLLTGEPLDSVHEDPSSGEDS